VPSLNDVVRDRNDDHASVHEDGPIHDLGRYWRGYGPEIKEPDGSEEYERRDIYRKTVPSQRPTPRWQRLFSKPFQDEATYIDVV
jgi:hypothetical protein